MRTEVGNLLARTIRAAQWADAHGAPSDEAVAGFEMSRRRFLGAMAATATVATVGRTNRASASRPRRDATVAIVGAGLGGLACAEALQRLGVQAYLCDANDRVGGRCYSRRGLFPGQVAEFGGEFLDNQHKIMLGYVNRLGLTREDRARQTGEVFYRVNGVSYPEAEVVDQFRAFVPAMHVDLQRLSNAPTPERFTEHDAVLDHTSLADYLLSRGAGPVVGPIIEAAYIGEYGREIDEQSALNFLLFMHADRRVKFTPFGFSDERFHVVEGNDAIPTGIHDGLSRDADLGVELLAARRGAGDQVTLTLARGATVFERSFDAVVLAIPFTTLRQVDLGGLDLPDWKTSAIADLRYGTNAKLLVGFDRPFWHDLGGTGDCFVSGAENLQNTWETNWTRASEFGAILSDFTGGRLGEGLGEDTLDAQVARFLADLEPTFPGALATATKVGGGSYRADRFHWPSQPLWQGSYTCNHPGYFTTMAGHEGTPVGNVFFAGEHADSFYSFQGFMEGAATSGRAAAAAVAALV
jgi:monoamine oxidase